MKPRHPVGDVYDDAEAPYQWIGSAILYTERNVADKPIKREFWIGFHCSAPGPSDAPDGPPGTPAKGSRK